MNIDIIEDERPIFLGLIDLLYCYAYNVRTTLGRSRTFRSDICTIDLLIFTLIIGDNTVESAWTIARLSPTLSWFDVSVTL